MSKKVIFGFTGIMLHWLNVLAFSILFYVSYGFKGVFLGLAFWLIAEIIHRSYGEKG